MGWGSGSHIMCSIIGAAMESFPEADRRSFYKQAINALEEADWDTQDEAMGIDPQFDEVMKELHPNWDWD